MNDPLGDMLTRIRNAGMRRKTKVSTPGSRLRANVLEVLKDEGYIEDFSVRHDGPKSQLEVQLKYYAGQPVIERIERVSRPGLRVYKGRESLPQVMNGLGVAIVSTPRGLMTDRHARKVGVGGEVIGIVA